MNPTLWVLTHALAAILGGVASYGATLYYFSREGIMPKLKFSANPGTIIIVAALVVLFIGVTAFQSQRQSNADAKRSSSQVACLDRWGSQLTNGSQEVRKASKTLTVATQRLTKAQAEVDWSMDQIVSSALARKTEPGSPQADKIVEALRDYRVARSHVKSATVSYDKAQTAVATAREDNPYRSPAEVCGR